MPINVNHLIVSFPIEFGAEVIEIKGVQIVENDVVLVIRQKMNLVLPEHSVEIEAAKVEPGLLQVKVRQEIPISETDVWRSKFPDELNDLTDEQVMTKLPSVLKAHELRMQYGSDIPTELNAEGVLRWFEEFEANKKKSESESTAKKDTLSAIAQALEKVNMSPDQLIEKLNNLKEV